VAKVSQVFQTSLYNNPFKNEAKSVAKPAYLVRQEEEEKKASPESSPAESPNASPVEETKVIQSNGKLF
jgi:hypothetical protein